MWRAHTLQGWSFSSSILDQAEKLGAHSVGVRDFLDGRVICTAPLSLVRARGITVSTPRYGIQVVLSAELWTPASNAPPIPIPIRRARAEQVSLFVAAGGAK